MWIYLKKKTSFVATFYLKILVERERCSSWYFGSARFDLFSNYVDQCDHIHHFRNTHRILGGIYWIMKSSTQSMSNNPSGIWACKKNVKMVKTRGVSVTIWDLMSTGTSSTAAKVALILSLTTPYVANSLNCRIAFLIRVASKFNILKKEIKLWQFKNLLINRLLVPGVLQRNVLLHAIFHRVLQLLEVHLRNNHIVSFVTNIKWEWRKYKITFCFQKQSPGTCPDPCQPFGPVGRSRSLPSTGSAARLPPSPSWESGTLEKSRWNDDQRGFAMKLRQQDRPAMEDGNAVYLWRFCAKANAPGGWTHIKFWEEHVLLQSHFSKKDNTQEGLLQIHYHQNRTRP